MMNKSVFLCPVCAGSLENKEGSLKCPSGHSFDIAKQGYVNLLLKNGSCKRHGDDALMVKARKTFLDKGYYSKMRDALCEIVGKGNVVLDAGCGEGYYTEALSKDNTVVGIDISKNALKYAARRVKDTPFAVASVSDIPLADNSLDVIVSIFAPESLDEFKRLLKQGGRLITVEPMEGHLLELKSAIYDNPYANPPLVLQREGFRFKSGREIKYQIEISTNEDIENLFKMTPYYYKTSVADQQKLKKISSLKIGLEFYIAEYEI